ETGLLDELAQQRGREAPDVTEVGAVVQSVLEGIRRPAEHHVDSVLPPQDVGRREEDRAAGPQHAMSLPHEALRVDDVLDDLRRDHDVERPVRVTEPRRDLATVEDVDLELVDVDAARLGVCAVDGIELDSEELDAVVAPESLEEHPARAAEV